MRFRTLNVHPTVQHPLILLRDSAMQKITNALILADLCGSIKTVRNKGRGSGNLGIIYS
jgi:hypothetical protein